MGWQAHLTHKRSSLKHWHVSRTSSSFTAARHRIIATSLICLTTGPLRISRLFCTAISVKPPQQQSILEVLEIPESQEYGLHGGLVRDVIPKEGTWVEVVSLGRLQQGFVWNDKLPFQLVEIKRQYGSAFLVPLRRIVFAFPFPLQKLDEPVEESSIDSIYGFMNRLRPKIQELKATDTWNHFKGRESVNLEEAAMYLFNVEAPENLTVEQKYMALRHILENYQYFKMREGLEFTCRKEGIAMLLQKSQDLLSDPDACAYFLACVVQKLIEQATDPAEQLKWQQIRRTLPAYRSVSFQRSVRWNPLDEVQHIFITALKWYATGEGELECLEPKIYFKLLQYLRVEKRPSDVFELLVKLGIFHKQENVHRVRAEIEGEVLLPFTEEVNRWTTAALFNIADPENREHFFLNSPIFAIDDTSTVEVDDAISLEVTSNQREWLHIHIADPSRLVSVNSDLDLTARLRASSVYLPEFRQFMFPLAFSRDHLSLFPHLENHAVTFSVRLAPNGQIEEYRITPSKIPTITRTNYHAVESLLSPNPEESNSHSFTSKEADALQRLYHWAKIRREYRKDIGATVTSLPKLKTKISADGKTVERVYLEEDTNASLLVSEMMILCGEVTGDFCTKNGIPAVFRTQPPPPDDDWTKPLPHLPPLINALRKIRTVELAETSAEQQPHHGLGLSAYIRVTSPLRRYADLLTHYQIKSFVRRAKLPFTQQELGPIASRINKTELEIKNLQKRSERFWVKQWLFQQGTEKVYNGTILHVLPLDSGPRAEVWLDVGLIINMAIPSTLPIGEQIAVKLFGSSPFNVEYVLA